MYRELGATPRALDFLVYFDEIAGPSLRHDS
jgi:hypothetical protein